MMTCPRRIGPPGSIFYQYDGASPEPSSTIRVRKRARDAIPSGAVAARIKLLQSFIPSLPGQPGPLPSKRGREDSRSGFGRRLSNRFGNPAVQSAQPDEEPQIDSRHSYLGLNIARSNHEEEHALMDSNTRYSRSPGINGQIDQDTDERTQYDAASPWGALSRTKSVPPEIHDPDTRYSRSPGFNGQIDQGTDERVQYDAASPWGALSRTKPVQPPTQGGHSPDLDVLKEIDSCGNQTQHMSSTSIFPSTAKKDNAGMFSRQIKPRRSKFVDLEASIMTTSTMRRQNVRDLFKDYGIQRPAGLASREVSKVMDEPTYIVNQRVFCHVCSWSNSRTTLKCWRCGHQFCTRCKEYSSQLPTAQEESLGHDIPSGQRQDTRNSVSNPKENRVDHDPMKRHQARPGPTPIQYSLRKASSPPIKFPDFRDPPKPQKSPSKTSVHVDRQEQNPVHLLTGRRITTSVKESPFLIADLKSKHSLRLFPAGMRGETHHIPHNHHKHQRQLLARYTLTVPSESRSCDSHVCRATHHGHQPFHNAPACPKRKPRHRVPDCTENGYIADTSCVDDAPIVQFNCNSRLSSPNPRFPQQPDSGRSHITCTTLGLGSPQTDVIKVDCDTDEGIPEYVECRGYPRTGHDRHGSPISTGIVGECQHCLDDCQCKACQNTHHSVRCCVHTDHQTIVHHHHTPRKTTIDYPEEHVVPDIEKAPVRAHGSQEVQPPPSKHHHQHTSKHVERIEESKESAHTKAPTPPPLPPMVSNPRYEDKRPHREARKADITRVEKIVEVTEPPSKNDTPSSHHAPQEDSGFEASAEPTNGTWFTITSEHDHDHVHSRRSSCPSSRKHSLGLPITQKRRDSMSSRTQIMPPESEKATRKLSTSRKHRNQSSVQALKERLLSHREQLQQIQQDCTEQINLPAHSGVTELARRIERKSNAQAENAYTPSISSKGSGGSKQKNWKLKLVDFNPEGRKKGGEEHQLSDDEVVSEKESYKAMPCVSTAEVTSLDWGDSSLDSSIVVSGREHILSVDEVVLDEVVKRPEGERERESAHDCVWKKRFKELSDRTRNGEADLGIVGVTVLVHLKGRENLVAKVESWIGGGLKD